MRKIALSLLVLASLGATSAAMAATTAPAVPASTATGAIKAFDAKACTVTLDTDAVYKFKAKCDFAALKVGEKVTVTYVTKTTLDASKIAAAV